MVVYTMQFRALSGWNVATFLKECESEFLVKALKRWSSVALWDRLKDNHCLAIGWNKSVQNVGQQSQSVTAATKYICNQPTEMEQKEGVAWIVLFQIHNQADNLFLLFFRIPHCYLFLCSWGWWWWWCILLYVTANDSIEVIVQNIQREQPYHHPSESRIT